jgi:CubicO group peptidase (beta-lactamase class C family)
MDAARLQAAIDFSIANQNPRTRDLALDLEQTLRGREPGFRLLGPTRPRGGMTGVIVRRGYVAAAWGEPDRVDMTFSATKSFLTTVVGVAWQEGLIRSLDDPVRDYMPSPELFATEHNARITWEHLLRQTSNWTGTLWEIPDSSGQPEGYAGRPLHAPGAVFNYNDVRVNLMALAALHVWRRPLPQVLRAKVMDPIGASNTWRWNGYENSWVVLDGERMQSVSGGGHYGGGMFINAWDMARFGYLFLRGGAWDGRRVVSEKWIAMARKPGPANPAYGFANWYPNAAGLPASRAAGGGYALPSAPLSSVLFHGAGANIVYMDWEHDLVVVVRWINDPALDGFIGRVLGAIDGRARP